MAVNDLTFNQLATVLTDITTLATGGQVQTPVDSASFVSVANTALLTGYDTVLNAVSQTLSRTIFSVRPYRRRFGGLEVSPMRWGNHIRKLQALDMPFEDEDRIKLVDGQSIDQYVVAKPPVLQTNYYGENVFQKHLTIFSNQLDVAFSSADEFGRFISMILSNASDQIEQAKESVERATVANLIGGTYAIGNSESVLHLVTLYNAYAGTEFTSSTIKQPENFAPFVRWLYGYLANVIDTMAERTKLYHLNITGKTIMRHTPKDRMKVYFNSGIANMIDTNVYSTTFHEDYLKKVDYTKVVFWQDVFNPMKIKADCGHINTSGSATHTVVDLDNVFGVMFDEDAAMMNTINQKQVNSPFNARGLYTNMYWHFTERYLNSNCENCVILLLD